MSSHSQKSVGQVAAVRFAVIALLSGAGALALAQDQPTPKLELYGGYSFFYPAANVHGTLPNGLLPVTSRLESNPRGVGLGITYNFNRWLGLTVDSSGHWGHGETGLPHRIDDAAFYNISAGPKLTYRTHHFSPFLEALVGENRLTPDAFHRSDKVGFLAGGGLDLNLSRHVALRLLRADYVYSNHHFGIDPAVPDTNVRGVRLQSGVVFLLGGGPPPPPVAYSCAANPSTVFPGDPVIVTGTALNLNPKKTANYNWTADRGPIAGTTSTANVNTRTLTPGTYIVKGHVSDGNRPTRMADCTAQYVVKAFEPPTITCSANPSSVNPGDSSTITANGVSPQNRPLTYSYSSTSGSINGASSTATLSTAGAAPGTITVTCNVVDDLGQTASQPATVTMAAPPVPAPPLTSSLCSVNFERDSRRPARVDNEAKACLDDIALNLQRTTDAKVAIAGNSAGTEKHRNQLATQRAVNTKDYLVTEKGIDASRIVVYTGSQDGKTVAVTLIPSGATLDTTGVTPFDESTVKPSRRTHHQ